MLHMGSFQRISLQSSKRTIFPSFHINRKLETWRKQIISPKFHRSSLPHQKKKKNRETNNEISIPEAACSSANRSRISAKDPENIHGSDARIQAKMMDISTKNKDFKSLWNFARYSNSSRSQFLGEMNFSGEGDRRDEFSISRKFYRRETTKIRVSPFSR